jgi:hypothetical protein
LLPDTGPLLKGYAKALEWHLTSFPGYLPKKILLVTFNNCYAFASLKSTGYCQALTSDHCELMHDFRRESDLPLGPSTSCKRRLCDNLIEKEKTEGISEFVNKNPEHSA